jgi:hypothetical protein
VACQRQSAPEIPPGFGVFALLLNTLFTAVIARVSLARSSLYGFILYFGFLPWRRLECVWKISYSLSCYCTSELDESMYSKEVQLQNRVPDNFADQSRTDFLSLCVLAVIFK